jgi:phosphatidylserine/phosphatidylglycerophosphate/cardiolipin synthase-like enzyme
MRSFLLFIALLSGACQSTVQAEPAKRMAASPNRVTWEVHFSPNGGCTSAAVALINGASRTIKVQAYSFTSKAITDALIQAQSRKIDIEAIFDSGDLSGPGTRTLDVTAAGVQTWYDYKHAIAHNKVIIVDDLKVLTGSFNFTEAAESRNAENCIILTGAQLAKVYTDNWNLHKSHSILTTAIITN